MSLVPSEISITILSRSGQRQLRRFLNSFPAMGICDCPLASSPNALDSPVVVLNTIGAEVDFIQLNALLAPTNDTSTTPTMAGSLQIAAPTIPNPTDTITNVYATGGGVGGTDSAATT
eukprot:scaffold47564_cov54-Cyclotella_meneghiniana.AAC.1